MVPYHPTPSPQPWSPFPSSQAPCRPIIEVTGEGAVQTTPDRAIIVLGVITENPSLVLAQTENAAQVTSVINALSALSIPKEHIQTVAYRIEAQYNYEDGIQTLRGYQVTHQLQITIDKVDQTGLVVDTAVKNGANNVSSIQFTSSNPGLYYNQALSLAIQNAEAKGGTITRTLGATLVRTPLKIMEESRVQEPVVPFQASMYAKSAAPTPIQPGELEIRASVKVHYTFF